MKRTLALAAAATITGGVAAFSVASYASSDHNSTSSDDPYTAAALDVANGDIASTSDPTSSPSPSGSNGSSKTAKRQFLHGERVVKDKDGKIITVDGQRGSVTAASGTSLTVKSDDGTTWTWAITKDTKVRGASLKVEPATSIKVGDTVAVGGQRTGDTRTARAVIDPPPNRSVLRGDLRKLRRDLRILHNG
jgi:hypothetical protein